jgi:hypothetical protein
VGLNEDETARADGEKDMKTTELQTILGYLNVGLAIAHSTGVTLGHFGSTDFISLAQNVNTLLLESLVPATASAVSTASSEASASTVDVSSTAVAA